MNRSSAPLTGDRSVKRPWRGPISSCLYALLVLAISAGLLFCNSLTSFVIYSAIPQSEDRALMAALSQLFFYLMPILLTFLQWYLIDRLWRFVSR
jgi:hypothetical protein